MDFGNDKKRGREAVNGNGSFKKLRKETESFTSGIGSKSKPCTKFFSPSGCPYGEGCHFLHYVPGGIKSLTEMLGSNPNLPRNPITPSPFSNESSSLSLKSRICTHFTAPEGCRYGDRCRFAHGEQQLSRPSFSSYSDPRAAAGGYGSAGMDPNPSFGASATAKVSIDASMAGAVIGKGGATSKQICRLTGARLAVRDHESNPDVKNIELEGSLDQIERASRMVQELISNLKSSSSGSGPPPQVKSYGRSHGFGKNLKTKMCDKFEKGCCAFGDSCNFAHGAEELRRAPGM